MSENAKTPAGINTRILDTVMIALCAAIIAACSWITVPFAVPFTMQTFAVFFVLRLLGGKKGLISIAVFIAMGAAGLPVFSGFRSGLSVLTGITGGYIIGFLFIALLYLIAEKRLDRRWKTYAVFAAGLVLCYAFGTAQFILVGVAGGKTYGVIEALTMCVFPFILPDIAKMILSELVASRIKKAAKFL